MKAPTHPISPVYPMTPIQTYTRISLTPDGKTPDTVELNTITATIGVIMNKPINKPNPIDAGNEACILDPAINPPTIGPSGPVTKCSMGGNHMSNATTNPMIPALIILLKCILLF
ncbi:hypothetical protein M1N24_02315 [Dehalococcoidia bacterium]|nr:hypothetical protein [Dehalococcoidia bacterium]